jgi:hypothetical protein
MMSIEGCAAADFAPILSKFAGIHCALHSEMCFIFAGIGTAPVSLPRARVKHYLVLPVARFGQWVGITQASAFTLTTAAGSFFNPHCAVAQTTNWAETGNTVKVLRERGGAIPGLTRTLRRHDRQRLD